MPGYICSKCGEVAAETATALVWHLKNRHALLVGRMFTCPITCGQDNCMRTFRYSYALIRHIQSTHGITDVENENVRLVVDNDDGDPVPDVNLDITPAVAIKRHPELNLEESDVTNSAAVFVAKMKASSSTVQSTVDHVVKETSNLFSDVIGTLKRKTEEFLQSKNIGEDDSESENLLQLFDQFRNPFVKLETSHQQQQYFTQSGYFIKPRQIPLGTEYHPRKNPNTGHVDQVPKHATFQYVPLQELLKVVLESKGFMKTILEHPASNDDIMRDFQDGLFCRQHEFFSDPRNIRLLLYVDECEIANPLGSKAGLHKISVIYCTILNLPPRFRSSLCNCFLISLFNSGDVKTYGYEPILRPLVNDIQSLEKEGLPITTDIFTGTLKVSIAQVTGDNLGMNGILGYVESFMSNHYCRHCRMHREEMQIALIENAAQRRNIENYEKDLQSNNARATGIKSPCLLNEVENFHVSTNHAPDVMHDLLEGVCGLEVHLVVAALMDEGLFDLDTLNSRITSFDYSPADAKNRPSPITLQKIQNPDGASGQTAAQMWCLIRYLPLLIGDKVPEGNEYFEVILLLLECMDFIFSIEVTSEETFFLKQLIKDHHEHFLEMFPERSLKPKHHFMTHYPFQMRMLGPLVHFWTMRFEAKHRFFKRLGHIVCNYRNILKTLCHRQQMFVCYNLMSGKDLSERDVEVGPGASELVASLERPQFLCQALNLNLFEEVYVARWCVVHGIKYSKNLHVITGKLDESTPIFQRIIYVIVINATTVKLVTEEWNTVKYHRHTHTYAIREFPTSPWSVVSIDELHDHYTYHASKSYDVSDSLCYVVMRHRVQ